jgi:phosphoribosylglycinamide formyltransferase-1
MRILILASGSGSLAQAIFEADLELEIVQVISDKDAQVLDRAELAGIPTTYLPFETDRKSWDSKLFTLVEGFKPDLVVSVGFMRILAANFVARFPTINTHPALLPNFPGAHAVRDALAAGVKTTGATVHWVDEGVDTGKVIASIEVPVLAGDDAASLHERIKIVERKLIVQTLAEFISNGIDGKK